MNNAAPTAGASPKTQAPLTPDLAAIKRGQQATWASGDYHMIGTQIAIVSELLIEALDLHSTERILDVATGSGNAAMAAARRGCSVVGIDYVPALLVRARRRVEADGLTVDFVAGDAEDLPFDDGSFDVVSSVFGAMFAPNQERSASELVRACRPGGRIGLVAHTPQGFIGQLFRTIAGTSRRRPACAPPSSGAPRRASPSCSAKPAGRSDPSSGPTSFATARRRTSSSTGGPSTDRRRMHSRPSAMPAGPRSRRTCWTSSPG